MKTLASVFRSLSDWCRCQPLDMTLGSLRPAHEGGVVAVALRDLLGGAAEQHHGVGGLEAGAGAERELDLARPELDLERAQRQAEIDDVGAQDLEDGSISS